MSEENDIKLKLNMLKKLVKMITTNQTVSNEFIFNMLKDNYENEEYWQYLSDKVSFPTNFIITNLDNINLKYLIKYQSKNLTEECLTNIKFMNKIIEEELIIELLHNINLPQKTIDYFILHLNKHNNELFWKTLSYSQKLSHEFIKIYTDKLNWDDITMCQKITLDFLMEYMDKIVWKKIPLNFSANLLINDNTITLFQNYSIWDDIGCLSNLSTSVIFNFFEKLNKASIISILRTRMLTVDQLKIILSKFNDNEIWTYISMITDLEDSFIDENINKLNWEELSTNYDFNKEQLIKYSNNINYELLTQNFNMCDEWISTLKLNGIYDNLTIDS